MRNLSIGARVIICGRIDEMRRSRRLAEWQLAGKIRFKEDVLQGIERMREAFLRLLHGKNFGKQIVRIN